MDLGIDLLTDDQLVELLIEACNALADRDPVVRKAAQGEIDKRGREAKMTRELAWEQIHDQEAEMAMMELAVRRAVDEAKRQYIEEIQKEVMAVVLAEMSTGSYRPLTPEEEAEVVVRAATFCDVDIIVAPGFSPVAVLRELERMGVAGKRTEFNVIRAVMNPLQQQTFRSSIGTAHQIRPVV